MTEAPLLLAIAPGLALMAWFYIRDRYEPEPIARILRVLFGGALAVPLAVATEMAACRFLSVDLAPARMDPRELFVYSFVCVAAVEELLKLLVVGALIYHDPELDEPYDGIVYSVAAALGFAILENVKVAFTLQGLGLGPTVARAFLAVPAHALFGVAMGWFVGAARFAPTRLSAWGNLALAWLVATVLHGCYDWLLLSRDPRMPLLLLPLMAAMWLATFAAIRQRLWESPFRPRD